MKARYAILVAAVVLGAGWLVRTEWRARPAVAAGAADRRQQLVVTTTAKRQDLLITVVETGVIAAKKSTPVIPEISGAVQWVCGNGVVVAPGGVLIRLDPTKYQEQVADLTVQYEDALRRRAQTREVLRTRSREWRLRLQQAKDSGASFERQQKVALQQLADAITFHTAELERQRQDVEVKRRLAAKGLIAGSEVERAEAALKAAEFSLQRDRGDYELKKSQAASDILDHRRAVSDATHDMVRSRSRSERDVRAYVNQVDNLKLQLDRAKEDLARTTITAPLGGLVVLSPQGRRQDARLPRMGDWINQGREVGQIVSLERMQVKLELDQGEITGVRMAQPAEITVEAIPGKVLRGRVTAIGQTARRPPVQGWGGVSSAATFPVTVDLPAIGKALIRPGMRATVRLVAQRVRAAVTVPASCVFKYDGRAVVYAERRGRFVRVPVTVGASNGDYSAIVRGLQAGERIALNDLGAAPANGAPTKGRRP